MLAHREICNQAGKESLVRGQLCSGLALEFAIIERLFKRHGHASAERVLSGPGLLELFHVLRQVQGLPAAIEVNHASQVLERVLSGGDTVAGECLNLFCGFLGSIAGDLALTLGARGGVYIGGGIVPRLGNWIKNSPFRQRFESKGRFQPYLQAIPTWVIQSPVSPALLGASAALDA